MTEQPHFTQEETKILARIPKEIVFVSFIGALPAGFIFDVITGILVFSGGILAAVSFSWLKNSISKSLLHGNKRKVLTSMLGSYLLRLLLIMAIFSFIIIFFSMKAVAFMAGFSTLILVFLGEAIVILSRAKKWKS